MSSAQREGTIDDAEGVAGAAEGAADGAGEIDVAIGAVLGVLTTTAAAAEGNRAPPKAGTAGATDEPTVA